MLLERWCAALEECSRCSWSEVLRLAAARSLQMAGPNVVQQSLHAARPWLVPVALRYVTEPISGFPAALLPAAPACCRLMDSAKGVLCRNSRVLNKTPLIQKSLAHKSSQATKKKKCGWHFNTSSQPLMSSRWHC